MNDARKILYTFNKDRIDEFFNEKNDEDEILLVKDIFEQDGKNLIEFVETNNYYIDITNTFKGFDNNSINDLENSLSGLLKIENVHIIVHDNIARKVIETFPLLFNKTKPINQIYKNNNECDRLFFDLTKDDLEKLSKDINVKLFGHNSFKEDFISQISNFSILYKIKEMKIFSLFICGDSGIGKTEIARIIHNSLYTHSAPIKINLGNYKSDGALNSLIGSPKGYYGSERGGELSNKIRKSDTKVILIDEFEKANTDIFNFFYELLEDGKFTDMDENEYDLNGYLIIFTTNLKKNDYLKVIPAPLASRFTMKYEFDKLAPNDKYAYIQYRVNIITERYNDAFKSDLKNSELLKQVLSYNISSQNNLRELNRYIHKALIDLVNKKVTKR